MEKRVTHMKSQKKEIYKLQVSEDIASKNVPHKDFHECIYYFRHRHVNIYGIMNRKDVILLLIKSIEIFCLVNSEHDISVKILVLIRYH